MKAITQYEYGDADQLSYDDVDLPVCGDDQVLVQVRAAGISPGDRAMVTGVPYVNRLAASGVRRPKVPIPGYDVAGLVSAVGGSVTRFEVGQEVFGNGTGSLAQYVAATEDQLAHKPTSWSFVEAAAVPESGCVALQAVGDHGQVQAGDRVAVIGAGGGVGSYAVQVAKAAGAHVTAVCGPAKVDGAAALGADDVIDYTVRDLDGEGKNYDVIIDAAGKAPLRRLRRALTDNGRLIIVGADHGHRITGGIDRWIRALLWSPFVSQTLRPFPAKPLSRDHLERLRDLMESGELIPVIDRTFPIESTADAMAYLSHREGVGKVVVVV
jgi:NADPH:quinone reductase-like Zn-dependent oxidoreductase